MIKNIIVLDIKGNMIGTTYPKRAKGLVKSGRACFVDGETVQLACSPEFSMQRRQEDMDMEMAFDRESLIKTIDQEVEKNIEIESEKNILENDKEMEIIGQKTEDTLSEAETIEKEMEKEDAKVQPVSNKVEKLMDAGISLKDVFHNLNRIHEDTGYIYKALDDLEKLPLGQAPDLGGQARAEAIADIVKCRETTNQMMIKLYTQVYMDYMES